MDIPKRLERTEIYSSEWVNLYTDRVEMPSGQIIEKYHQIELNKKSTSILLLNEKDEVCLVLARRYTTQQVTWEVPAGFIEAGETAIEAATRELHEEAGIKIDVSELTEVYDYLPSVGISTENVSLVVGRVHMPDQNPILDNDEVADIRWFNKDELRQRVKDNLIRDGVTLIAVLYALMIDKNNEL